jgi:hypothetical protein
LSHFTPELFWPSIAIEADLGRRSFYDFYHMAWPTIDPETFVAGRHIRVIAYAACCVGAKSASWL